jgi:cytochrome P450
VTGADQKPVEVAHDPVRRCPVSDVDYRIDRPIFWNYASLSEVRGTGPVVWNSTEPGYWMITRYEEIKEAFRMEGVFTNRKVNAFDSSMDIRLLPQNLDGDEHRKLRALLNPWFSPGGVKRMDPVSRARCTTLIEELAPKGRCDFVAEFGILYPTEVFLTLLGLPVEDGPTFVGWVEAIFGGFFNLDATAAEEASASTQAYFEAVLADRLVRPRGRETDFVSYLLASEIDGRPVPHEDIVTICSTIMLAGLDTTRSALGYIFHHLATHDADRARIADPDFAERAMEEFLRLYSLLIQDGRYVARDVEFHGCPMKEGEMVSLGIISANRDPRKFDRPDEFYPERGTNPHIAFGLGPHRCLGMHLARRELAIAIEEWHARIPDYHLEGDPELVERGGQLSLLALPLAW